MNREALDIVAYRRNYNNYHVETNGRDPVGKSWAGGLSRLNSHAAIRDAADKAIRTKTERSVKRQSQKLK